MCHLALIFTTKYHMHLFLLLLLLILSATRMHTTHSHTLMQRVQKLRAICGAFSLHLLLLLLFFLFVHVAHSLLIADFTFLWRNSWPRAAIVWRAFACNHVNIAGCFLARPRDSQIKAQPHIAAYWQLHLVFRIQLPIHRVGRFIPKIGNMLVGTSGINTIPSSEC